MCDRQCSRSESKGKEVKWTQVENSNGKLDRDEEQARKTITLPTTRIR